MSDWGFFVYALVALFIIIDPAGNALLFLGLTPHHSDQERKAQAAKACLTAFIILTGFGVLGELFLHGLGISLAALRVAGGILLFLAAIDMVMANHHIKADPEKLHPSQEAPKTDISIFPMAIPLIAGPGAMTTMVVLKSDAAGGRFGILLSEAALLIIIVLSYICLRLAKPLLKILGPSGADVLGRVLGILVAAIAMGMILQGLQQALHL